MFGVAREERVDSRLDDLSLPRRIKSWVLKERLANEREVANRVSRERNREASERTIEELRVCARRAATARGNER